MEKLEEFHNNNFGDTKCKVVKKLEYLIKYKILVNPLKDSSTLARKSLDQVKEKYH